MRFIIEKSQQSLFHFIKQPQKTITKRFAINLRIHIVCLLFVCVRMYVHNEQRRIVIRSDTMMCAHSLATICLHDVHCNRILLVAQCDRRLTGDQQRFRWYFVSQRRESDTARMRAGSNGGPEHPFDFNANIYIYRLQMGSRKVRALADFVSIFIKMINRRR